MILERSDNMSLDELVNGIYQASEYFNTLTHYANLLDQIFNTMLEQFNSIGVKVIKLLIQDRFILIFPEDFEDMKLFNSFREWYDEKNHSLSITVMDVMKDKSSAITICDAMYQNITRITEMQYRKGIWPPNKTKDEGTE